MLKTNSFPGKRSDTPDSSTSAQRTVSPVQNTGPGSPNSSMVATNHHPIPHLQHHQNHRPYFPRGRYRGDGGYYGGHNHFGGHHPNLNRRTSPPIHGPPFSKDLVDFMMKEWDQFSTNYRSTHPGDPIDNGLVMHSGHHQHQQHQPIVSTSPRVGGHVNSPHRGQHIRYNHQNSPGNNWSINNGGNGRKYSENGDHSNTGSLRRHHNHRGGHAPSPLLQGNQPWQRSTLTNRQNSPNNTLNRPTGFSMPHYLPLQPRRRPRHTYPSRPIVSPTSPAAASVTSAATSPVAEASSKVAETAAVPVAEMHSLSLKSADTSKPTSAAAPVANGKKNAEGLTEPPSAAPAALLDVEAKKRTTSTTTMSRDEAASSTSSSSTSSLTISKVKQQQQQTSDVQQQRQHHQHSTRRRAATTQGGSSVSASTTAAALPLSSSLPATRASETASVASSSFCSLVDQVDTMSAADQYFTPEPPSPSSSASASLSVGVSETSHHFTTLAAVESASTESPPLPSPPPLAPAPVSSSAFAATATTTNR
uniref:MIF4G domain-containing protein n=1 Tax=Echinococcus granulosus TaxID=6210 RepID=A0A068WT61_ECHGR|nr:hypothetical protein EgrG_000084450 [Echinococcus granulosus]